MLKRVTTVLKEAIYHRPSNQYAYSYDQETLHLMIQTKQGDMDQVELIYGDPNETVDNRWNYHILAMEKSGSTTMFDYWKCTVKPKYRRLRYGFRLTNQDGQVTFYVERGFYSALPTDLNAYFSFPYLHTIDTFTAPRWVKDTVWYQIFPERFANGDANLNPLNTLAWGSAPPTPENMFGGDFQGIINQLDYLETLGITGIYLCPIFKAHSNHKYDTIDYMKIDPQFGDEQTFRKLIEACHNRGMRVILDAVFNHCGYYFEPFQDLLTNGEESKYKEWFYVGEFPIRFTPIPNYATFGFVSTMPKLNTGNIEVKSYLLKVARYWVEVFDIDGWRLDVANEVDHAFWREFRQVVKLVKPEAYILGKIWHDSMPWLQGEQFDAVMNYPFAYASINFFAKRTINVFEFTDYITQVLHMYPDNVNEYAFNILDSHDTARIMTLADNKIDHIRLLYLFQLSFVGTPCLYYGDEIGMRGGNDPECRACMEWDQAKQNGDLFAFVKQLIQMRKEIPAFGNDARFKFLQIDQLLNTVVYEKKNEKGHLIFVLNNSEEFQTIDLSLLAGKQATELFGRETRVFSSKTEITLNPLDFKCFQVK